MPLDDEYSFDYEQDKVKYDVRNGIKDAEIIYDFKADTGKVREKYGKSTGKVREKLNENQKMIVEYTERHGKITNKEVQKTFECQRITVIEDIEGINR